MNENRVVVTMSGLNPREAGLAIQELESIASRSGARPERLREDASAQDLGTAIVLFFGTKAAVKLAEGIAAWLQKRGSRATVKLGETTLELSGDAASDIGAVMRALGAK